MRVLHLVNDLVVDGGAQRIVRDLALGTPDCEASVLTLRPAPDAVRAELERGGVEVASLRPFGWSRLARARRMARAADVVHVHLFPSLYLGALLSRPKVFTEHNTKNRRRERPWLRPIERWVHRRYERIGCISEGTRVELERWVGDLGERAQVVPNGIRLERFAAPARRAPEPVFRLLMVGQLTAQKDQATLVRALARLPEAYALELVGDGATRGELEALARELGVDGRVTFHGCLPNEVLPELMQRVDLYVQSSNWEGFGLAPVEAMAAGLPALASDVPGLAEVVDDPARRFPVGDDERLATLARELCEDGAAYEGASEAARTRAAQFGLDAMARHYRELYDTARGRTASLVGAR